MLMSFFIPNSAAESKNYNIFGLAQLLWIVVPLAILIVFCLIFRNRKKEGRIPLIILASTMLLLRVLNILSLSLSFGMKDGNRLYLLNYVLLCRGFSHSQSTLKLIS